MTGPAVVAAVCLVLAAVSVMWPVPGARARHRRLLGPYPPGGGRLVGRLRSARMAGAAGQRLLLPAALAAAVIATVFGGPVAGLVTGVYSVLAGWAAVRRRRDQVRARHRAALLDALAGAAGDLRAGLPAGDVLAGVTGVDGAGPPGDPVPARVEAAARLAEQTGAPLADALERIEADARSTDRARAASAAHAAGSRATAWLLAALPAGGIGLGYGIGADPLAILLYTPAGAACALAAVTLQLTGLAWVRRIARPAPAVSA